MAAKEPITACLGCAELEDRALWHDMRMYQEDAVEALETVK